MAELVAAGGAPPGLATVLIGDDPASEVYVRNKRRACTAAGMRDLHQHLAADVSQEEAALLLGELAADTGMSGILLQLPTRSTWTPTRCWPGSRRARTWTD